jgi:hypothetical protein
MSGTGPGGGGGGGRGSAETSKEFEVSETSGPEATLNVCVPIPVIARPGKVATPFTAFTTVVPESEPLPLAIAIVTGTVDDVTTPLDVSRTCAMNRGLNGWPDTALLGCDTTTSCVAGPPETPKFALVDASEPDVKVSVCAPVPVMARFVNDATPFTALTTVVPESVPPPLVMATVTGSVAEVTTPLDASRIWTTG